MISIVDKKTESIYYRVKYNGSSYSDNKHDEYLDAEEEAIKIKSQGANGVVVVKCTESYKELVV